MEPIDRKFRILAVNPCKEGAIYTEKDGFFFKASDPFAIDALVMYISALKKNESVQANQIIGAKLLLERVIRYQKENGVKIPDVDLGCEQDIVCDIRNREG
jgi:hypothetical protein